MSSTTDHAQLDPRVGDLAVSSSQGIAISLWGITKVFQDKPVLNGIDLLIPEGQFVAVVGRSGCGKSTLLRLIGGLDTVTSGTIRFGNSLFPATQNPVRVMFQEPRLLPWARVLANVEIGLGNQNQDSATRQHALATLSAVGLAERANEWPSILSGGQKQRVALARALVSGPRLLAFDEPLGSLDALTRLEMQSLLEAIWLRDRFTAILVTHDVAEALTLADRILMIEDGKIGLDLPVDLPRPRRRGSVDLASLEGRILDLLLRNNTAEPQGSDRAARY
jgi:sulfonate transport system ATP-binding protein